MPISDAKKEANKRYDDKNMAYQTIKVSKTLLQEFKQKVEERGERVNTVFREFMEEYIKK